jgi:hypothetical protein
LALIFGDSMSKKIFVSNLASPSELKPSTSKVAQDGKRQSIPLMGWGKLWMDKESVIKPNPTRGIAQKTVKDR